MQFTIKSYQWECDICGKTVETKKDKLPPGWASCYGSDVCSEKCKKEMTVRQSDVYCIEPGGSQYFEMANIIDWRVDEGNLYLTVIEGFLG